MEPSGRNWWQRLANGTRAKTAQASKTVAVGCDRLPSRLHGKEGVDGSSPSEGLKLGLGSEGISGPWQRRRASCKNPGRTRRLRASSRASTEIATAFEGGAGSRCRELSRQLSAS